MGSHLKSLEKQVRNSFGLNPEPNPDLSELPPNFNYPPLRYLPTLIDFPDLWGIEIHSHAAIQEWTKSRTLKFPHKCCVCLGKAEESLSGFEPRFFGLLSQKLAIRDVPHCREHADGPAKLAVANGWLAIQVIGLNEKFLLETFKLNALGDIQPPWLAFPGHVGVFGWNQGVGEEWFPVWQKFWLELNQDEREAYVARWEAPPDWYDALITNPVWSPE